MARKKRPGMANFFVPAATFLIVFAAIISFNSKNITKFLMNKAEQYDMDNNIAEKLSNSDVSTDTSKEDNETFDGPYIIKRVVDGDTFVVSIEDTDAKIRLIGVDTPESVAVDGKENSEEGKIASDYTKELLTDRSVYLEYDAGKTDKYGRILAYAYYEEDGQMIMVNQKLLSEGMAQLMTIQPNVKYSELFTETQEAAREAGKGFWKDNSFTSENAE